MNHPVIAQGLANDRIRERLDRAQAERLAGSLRRARRVREPHDVVIREARPADARALARLARLDDASTPDGRTIVAIVDGRMVAAAGDGGLVIADPFMPTDAVVTLLEKCARQFKDAEGRSRRARRHEQSEPAWSDCPAGPTGAPA